MLLLLLGSFLSVAEKSQLWDEKKFFTLIFTICALDITMDSPADHFFESQNAA